MGIVEMAYTESFNTCSSCEEQLRDVIDNCKFAVSIHAPLARSNLCWNEVWRLADVSIHAPLARSNTRGGGRYLILDWFQYMLLLRGATRRMMCSSEPLTSFNTCSSCEEQLE